MAESSTPGRGGPPFIDNPYAPEVFAEGAIDFLLLNGNVHITFATPRSNYGAEPPALSRVIIGRLVMPLGGAQALAIGLYDFLKSHGVDPAQPVPGRQIQ